MLRPSHVLVADDEINGRRMLEILLSQLGYKVSTASDGSDALKKIRRTPVDLVITDLNMPNVDGLELLSALRETDKAVPVIVVTSFGSIETAVTAMKSGAFDFIARPFNVDHVEAVIKKALLSSRLKQENDFLRAQIDKSGWEEFVGESQEMRGIYQIIKQAAPHLSNVFITGETGTGKELVARAIHKHSGRKGLFVPVNCAALSSTVAESELFGHVRGAFTGADKDRVGKFEYANEGTLFLDEITEMNVELQAKLLRVLQEKKVERVGSNRSIDIDLRIIAATNRDYWQAIDDGRLRNDVFYRLNVFNIHLPRLRDRKEDILLLAQTFIEKYKLRSSCINQKITLSRTAREILLAYAWPGNVRELENIIERAVILCRDDVIDENSLPFELQISAKYNDSKTIIQENQLDNQVSSLEKTLIIDAIQKTGGNKAKAARLLEISERSLWYKLKKYSIV